MLSLSYLLHSTKRPVVLIPKLRVKFPSCPLHHLLHSLQHQSRSLSKKDWYAKNLHLRHHRDVEIKGSQVLNLTLLNQRRLWIKPQSPEYYSNALGYWSLICSGMVFVAVVLGGVTRLTESGLSMVSWSVLGEKIPMNEDAWTAEFDNYKKFPEFRHCNKDMEMDDFKWIWWMEYIHRMWGRLIGFTFVLPASYFWFRGALQPAIKRRLLLLGVLIGFQGLMGWHMVKSGLEDQFNEPSDVPRVSQYRLAAHLSLALLIYAGLLHISLNQLLSTENRLELCSHAATSPSQLRGLRQFQICARMSKVLIFLTAISGAFVAGLDAGLIYNSFPKMSNQWIPDDIVMFHPVWKNFTENPSLVQLDHRILGMLTLSSVTFTALISRKIRLTRRAQLAVRVAFVAGWSQVMLGIITLINHVPTSFAAVHQSGSLILMSTLIWVCHEIKCIQRIMK